ncbi:MAG: hypothetical protein JEZ03_18430, partial [Bacteroidales bacterium]|nr:hypothetical protein [Bacteroidales bacterium]
MSISALVICFQYDQALIVAPDSDLPYLFILSILIAVFWCVVLFVIIYIDIVLPFLPRHKVLLAWGINFTLPLLILSYGLFTLFVSLCLRQNRLVRVGLGRILYYGGTPILQVICGFYFGASENMYLLAQSIGALSSVLLMIPYAQFFLWQKKIRAKGKLLSIIIKTAKIHSRFPRFQMGAGFVNAASIYMPIIFLRVAFSDSWAGWYFMAWRLLASPVTLFSQAIGQVFYRDSAERERKRINQGVIVENIVSALARLSFMGAFIVLTTVTPIIYIVLGNEW